MQQSPCFNLFSPDGTSKLFTSFQRFNNCLCSPRTLFFGLGLSSSGQNSYSKKNILSKMKFSSSNTKKIYNNSNKPIFLSNKRNFTSESAEKNNNKLNSNNKKINKTNHLLNTVLKNEESVIESQPDIKKTKASSKKNSTYIPFQCADTSNINLNNNNNYGYNNYNTNNPNYGCISNSSLIKFNKTSYIGSVKKNLLPSLSMELRSNTKNKNNINNMNENIVKINNNNNIISSSIKKSNNNRYNSSNKKKNNSNSKTNLNNSNNKTTDDSTPYDYLCKTTESLDLEKMVDYIVSSTKIYNRYNDNKENYSNNHLNNLINYNESYDENGYFNIHNTNNYTNTENKSNRKNKKESCCKNSSFKTLNNQLETQKAGYSICKCKKVECLKYSCSCLKSGNKCSSLCSCINCKNKDKNLFKIDG